MPDPDARPVPPSAGEPLDEETAAAIAKGAGADLGNITDGLKLASPSPTGKARDLSAAELAEVFKAFGSRIDENTGQPVYFQPALSQLTTNARLTDAYEPIDAMRADDPPPNPIEPWEMRIGGCRLIVPPINVNVSQAFRTGSLTGGALRSTSSPKFNSGYSETMIEVTLYFPTHESIWGFDDPHAFTVDFDHDNYEVIDRFLSSLRGLVAQFRYAPILPIRNVYLNKVHNITAVALQGMTVSTVEGYPFCVAVNLTLLKFNHKVFLPMLHDFNESIRWGRFRQYMGRAAARLADVASQEFLLNDSLPADETGNPIGVVENDTVTPGELLSRSPEVGQNGAVTTFTKADRAPGRAVGGGFVEPGALTGGWDGKHFEIYRPLHDPARIDIPDLRNFAPDADDSPRKKNVWEALLVRIGINKNTEDAKYEKAFEYAQGLGNLNELSSEARQLMEFIQAVGTNLDLLGDNNFEEYLGDRAIALGFASQDGTITDQGGYNELRNRLRPVWYGSLFRILSQDPFFARVLARQDLLRGTIFIEEWEVPMVPIGLSGDEVRNFIHVQGVSVSMGNNFARLQVQMHPEPTHQHIGGLDTTASISMIVFGEQPLIMLRAAFESTNAMARLEHAHGVLGFLGIKNTITALCGMRYCLPSSFEVDTVPNYPHVYQVRLSVTDFDIFQQKREMLSATQQAELTAAFKTKKNPFLRIKQLWGAFNAYPDFPLTVRDEDGNVAGCLDPDFYFRGFETFDDDIVTFGGPPDDPAEAEAERVERAGKGLDNVLNPDTTVWSLGRTDKTQLCLMHPSGMDLIDGDRVVATNIEHNEAHAANILTQSSIPGTVPPAVYCQPYHDGSGSPKKQYESMMKDTQYRDKAGRMVRAFPTYMLWLIDEGGLFAGMKMTDNFYGLQSVIDFSLNRSEDIMGDTLVLRLSNLYSRLSTPFGQLLDEKYSVTAKVINQVYNFGRRLLSGTTDYLVDLDSIDIRPGVRVHLRMGYSSNPNAMDTVFNGVVTEVQLGEILTITAQSDAIELGALVNATNKNGHSGKIDGNMVGFYLSEPRDLMIRLMTMGSSVFREALSQATRGKIFSENRFGIRHFGAILYAPMTPQETETVKSQQANVRDQISVGSDEGVLSSLSKSIMGFVSDELGGIIDEMWINFAVKRDYELFKRNIYPGNGTGIAQFMGFDMAEGGLANALQPKGVTRDGRVLDLTTGKSTNDAPSPTEALEAARRLRDEAAKVTPDNSGPGLDALARAVAGGAVAGGLAGGGPIGGLLGGVAAGAAASPTHTHEFLKILGVAGRGLDDVNEISFRAQTFMKTVWDLFQLSAALCPNYIVAVRPFEDRSTVFYGKPHWTYTSGVIPISLGVGVDENGLSNEPAKDDEDAMLNIMTRLSKALLSDQDLKGTLDLFDKLKGHGYNDPAESPKGTAWNNSDPTALPLDSGVVAIAQRRYTIIRGLHLPVDPDLKKDEELHDVKYDLPLLYSHPFYMDRAHVYTERGDGDGTVKIDEGGQGIEVEKNDYEVDGTIKEGDKREWPGKVSEFGYFPVPEDEKWYVSLPWGKTAEIGNADVPAIQVEAEVGLADAPAADARLLPASHIALLKQCKVLVYCPRLKTACVTRPGNVARGANAVVSPEVMAVLQAVSGADECFFGFVDPATPLGPMDMADFRGEVGNADGPAVQANVAGAQETEATQNSVTAIRGEVDWLPEGHTDPTAFAEQYGATFLGVSASFDDVGTRASAEWATHKTNEQADEIWDEFRAHFGTDEEVIKAYEKWKGVDIHGAKPVEQSSGAKTKETLETADKVLHPVETAQKWAIDTTKDVVDRLNPFNDDEPSSEEQLEALAANPVITEYEKEVREFLQWMWEDAYRRGWLVRTTEKMATIGGTVDHLFDWADTAIGFVVPGGVGLDQLGDGTKAAINFVLEDRKWNFDRAHELLPIFWSEGGPDKAMKAMPTMDTPGDMSDSHLGKAIDAVLDPVEKLLASLGSIVAGIGGGLSTFYRLAEFQLSNGLAMTSDMQKRTNMLNRIYNDSIYYQAGSGKDLDLLRLADNPFTREYGEPVVEIREPFQRIHFISSFQHILGNGIIENTDGVATVITAVSNGKHPVTVHFDKGAAVEHQYEKVVETGLYWDSPTGWFGLQALLHPVQAMRMTAKARDGGDVIASKKVALWHLKESLKDIYAGEILVLGDPGIRPHDLVYLSDEYSRMYGFFEVEAVNHHFTPETGFVTAIVPNAMVTVNDPARWNYAAYMTSRMNMKRLRSQMRETLQVRADSGRSLGTNSAGKEYSVEELTNRFEEQILDSTQFSGGLSAIIKDMAGSFGSGMLLGFWEKNRIEEAEKGTSGISATLAGMSETLTTLLTGETGGWGAWNWVRDNLLDQHGCYISYLTQRGKPMDAGLSPNSSVAVGQMHGTTLMLGGLRIGTVAGLGDVSVTGKDGKRGRPAMITHTELLAQLGWSESDLNSETGLGKQLDSWTNATYLQIDQAAGRGISVIPFTINDAYWVKITKVVDGDTFWVQAGDGEANFDGLGAKAVGVGDGQVSVRLLIADCPEDPFKDQPQHWEDHVDDPGEEGQGIRASAYSRTHMSVGTQVALRIINTRPKDGFDRLLAFVFHNSPVGLKEAHPDQHKEFLLTAAKGDLDWQTYLDDGRPYTYNQQIMEDGHAKVEASHLKRSLPNGVRRTGF